MVLLVLGLNTQTDLQSISPPSAFADDDGIGDGFRDHLCQFDDNEDNEYLRSSTFNKGAFGIANMLSGRRPRNARERAMRWQRERGNGNREYGRRRRIGNYDNDRKSGGDCDDNSEGDGNGAFGDGNGARGGEGGGLTGRWGGGWGGGGATERMGIVVVVVVVIVANTMTVAGGQGRTSNGKDCVGATMGRRCLPYPSIR